MTNDALNTITYDAENRTLSSAGSLGSATYSYDGNGLRVLKTSSSATTIYIYNGTKVLAEYASGASVSSPTAEYAYMGGRLLSKFASGATTYYHRDRLSTRLITDSSGNVLTQQGHYPFGESWYITGSATKWEFTSYERDAESSNDYAKFRYGVNRLGRFSTGDPVELVRTAAPQTFNRYAYVANDPINRKDAVGRLADYCGDPYMDEGLNENDYGDPIWYPGFGSLEGDDSDNVPSDVQWLYCGLPFNPPEPFDCLLNAETAIYSGDTNIACPSPFKTGPYQGTWTVSVVRDQPPTANQGSVSWVFTGEGGVENPIAHSEADNTPFTSNVTFYIQPILPHAKKTVGIKAVVTWTCQSIPHTARGLVRFTCVGKT
jgi:RHS repeat-associated protein